MCCVFLVVWKPGDSAMVEWPVVERGLCVIRGVPRSWLCWAHLEHSKSHACTLKDSEPWQVEKCCYVSRINDPSRIWVRKPVLTHLSAWLQKDQIILYDMHKVFAVDALASSHPLSRREEEVNDPSQISEMFNTISYSKVCSSNFLQYLMQDLSQTYSIHYNFAPSHFSQKYYRQYS